MQILMITSEAVPFAKTGGLADVVSALSYSLKNLGHDVRIVMPRYYRINKKDLTPIPGAMGVSIGNREYWTEVFESTLPNSDIPVYFIDHSAVTDCTVLFLNLTLMITPNGFRS